MKKSASILPLLMVIISIFIALYFTKDLFYNLKQNKQDLISLEQKLEQSEKELNDLKLVKEDIEAERIQDINFEAYTKTIKDNEITKYFYDYANDKKNWVVLNSISFSEWSLNDYWFKEASISLSLSFDNKQKMTKMLNYLIDSQDYNFYIHSFSYPKQDEKEQFNVSIPLKVLYK